MATIGQPLNQADVQRALGVSTSVNTWSALLTHSNINMWSAYKPLYSTKKTRLTDAERASGAHTMSGYSASYGIQKRISSSWSDFLDSYGAIKSYPWIYDKPVVDGSCGLRITDYIGYRSDASRLVSVTFSSWDLWLPSASGSSGSSLWIQLNGLSTVSATNTGAMRWQELFGDHLGYYPTLIMTAGTNWVYAKSSDYTINDLIGRGDTGAIIYVNTDTLCTAMITDGNGSVTYGNYPISNNASWNVCMVLCSRKISGGTGSIEHHLNGSENILRCEYLSGADRTIKTAKLLKYKAFSSMSCKVTLVKEGGHARKYRLDKIELTAEKLTEDAVSFTCDLEMSSQIGDVYIGTSPAVSASGGQAARANNYFGTITFAANETGTVVKTWQYNATSGNALPYTYWDITSAYQGSYIPTIHLYFHLSGVGDFDGGDANLNVASQDPSYTIEFNLF